MDIVTLLLFLLGLILLIAGAEALVRGSSRLAAAIGISPLVIGLTVVAYGTSSPELAVSVQAGLSGQADIALGNIIGSNIFNVLFILGLSALLVPLVVAQQLVRWDVPLMIGTSLLFLILALDGKISRLDGALLFAGNVAYVIWAIRQSRQESSPIKAEYAREYGDGSSKAKWQWLIHLAFAIVGLAMLVLGSRWLVHGAVTIARVLGLSELIIGLTIIAAGTSLPEVATSIIASIRGERDIAVGNVVGSNIFNILSVLGLASLVSPNGVKVAPAALNFDIPVMIAVAAACLPIFFTGSLIARWEGALFLAYYFAYTLYLILDAMQHDALPAFSSLMLEFVLPLTVITLCIVVFRAWRLRRQNIL
ncbi:MAG: calcium/sodium antiporter [candidate division KSB1 bacterium]|nr:calcium/sodium antiporter [candidate division KSB1 bacterium]MDZ7304333.1 calcium/sodium antiporter [candidate division KSB1 bacterium]